MAQYDGGLSKFNVSVDAPDLSNVMRMSRNLGKNSATADFYEMLSKQQAEDRKAAAKERETEQKAASNDLASNPESQSFWDSLGQKAGGALWSTFDYYSRGLYAMEGFIEETSKEAYQGDNNIWDGLSKGFSAANSAFEGKRKKDFIQAIMQEGARDGDNTKGWRGWRDNKALAVGVGLTADILLDPLTYVGAGLVSKPLKVIKETKLSDEVLGTLESLKISNSVDEAGKPIFLTKGDFSELLGNKPVNSRPAHWNSMTRKERRVWTEQNTIRGVKGIRNRSQDIARTRNRLGTLESIHQALKADPNVSGDGMAAVKKMIDETHAALGEAAEKYGKSAYRSALKKFDEATVAPPIAGTAKGAGTAEKFDEVVTINRLKAGLRAKSIADKNGPSSYNGKMMDKAFTFLRSDRVSDSFKAGWFGKMMGRVERDVWDEAAGAHKPSAFTKNKKQISYLSGQVNNHIKDVARNYGLSEDVVRKAVKDSGSEIRKMVDGEAPVGTPSAMKKLYETAKAQGKNPDLIRKLQGHVFDQRKTYAAQDDLKAKALYELIAEDVNLTAMRASDEYGPELADIELRLNELGNTKKRLDDQALDRHPTAVSSAVNPNKAGLEGDELASSLSKQDDFENISTGSLSADEASDVGREMAELYRQRDALQAKFYRNNPEAAFFNKAVTDEPIIHKPGKNASDLEKAAWDAAKIANADKRAKEIYGTALETEKRLHRADDGADAKHLKTFSGDKADGTLRIKEGDEWLSMDDLKKNPKLVEKLATAGDRKKLNAAGNQHAATLSTADNLPDVPSTYRSAVASLVDKWRKAPSKLPKSPMPDNFYAELPNDWDRFSEEIIAAVQKGSPPGSSSKAEQDLNALIKGVYREALKKNKPAGPKTPITPLYKIVFDREFKKRTLYTVEDANNKVALAKGRAVTWGVMGKAKPTTKVDFIHKIKSDPGKYARTGHGVRVPLKHFPGDKSARAAGVKGTMTATQWKNYVVKSVPGKDEAWARRAWDDAFADFVNNSPEAHGALSKAWEALLDRQKNAAKGIDSDLSTSNVPVAPERKKELWDQAREQATKEIDKRASLPNLADEAVNSHNFGPVGKPGEVVDTSIEAQHKVLIEEARVRHAQEVMEAKLANPDPRSKPALLAAQLDELAKRQKEEIQAYELAKEEAVKARDVMAKYIEESMDLNTLDEALRTGSVSIRVKFGRLKIADIPAGEKLTKAVESASQMPVIGAAYRAWSEAFSPASRLEPELNLARLRAQSETANIIKHHLDTLKHTFGAIKPNDRKHAFKSIRDGNTPVGDTATSLMNQFDEIAQYTSGRVQVGDDVLEPSDINNFLPDEFKFKHPDGKSVNAIPMHDGPSLLKAMRDMNPDADPMKALWSLRIATEQAMARKALQSTITKTFGIKRLLTKEEKGRNPVAAGLVETLQKKHDWVTVKEIGESHYFPRDVAEQVEKLMKMMKPQEIAQIMRGYDKTLRFWKSAVTVYNPGYYARNAIGETIMNLFDGVNNQKHYRRAAAIIKTKMPDATKETLKQMEPWKKYQSPAQAGARVAVELKGGVTLTSDEVWILYNDVGLKSGFISTEFDHLFPAGNTIRSTGAGQVATKINDSVRWVGEKQEDYFRLTHFISRMERSGINVGAHPKHLRKDLILKIAEDAAVPVRKYHFDYTDFTPFEKATMLRVIPFYKWTRKALPLMAGMMFTQPGKVVLYPKTMNALSYSTGGSDPLTDTNGMRPDYEGVVPEWIKNLAAYPIGENFPGDDTGSQTFMNIATPTFDIYKMMQNPVSATIGMMSPGIKLPLELARGETLDPDFEIDLRKEGMTRDHLMRTTPATSLLEKNLDGKDTSQTLASFLTGLGFYQNSEERQKAEEMRRNFDK